MPETDRKCPGCEAGSFSDPFCSDDCHNEWAEVKRDD